MLTNEEEIFAIELQESLENLKLNQLSCIIGKITESSDITDTFRRIKLYKRRLGEVVASKTKYMQDGFMVRLIGELYEIGKLEKWEDDFLNILRNYLDTRNISLSINSISDWNRVNAD